MTGAAIVPFLALLKIGGLAVLAGIAAYVANKQVAQRNKA